MTWLLPMAIILPMTGAALTLVASRRPRVQRAISFIAWSSDMGAIGIGVTNLTGATRIAAQSNGMRSRPILPWGTSPPCASSATPEASATLADEDTNDT